MKYRGNSKIKYEHSMIKGLKLFLESIEGWEEIKSIIPGRINQSKSYTELHLTIQYKTNDGVKCLAKGEGIQEVFFVSSVPNELIIRLNKLL